MIKRKKIYNILLILIFCGAVAHSAIAEEGVIDYFETYLPDHYVDNSRDTGVRLAEADSETVPTETPNESLSDETRDTTTSPRHLPSVPAKPSKHATAVKAAAKVSKTSPKKAAATKHVTTTKTVVKTSTTHTATRSATKPTLTRHTTAVKAAVKPISRPKQAVNKKIVTKVTTTKRATPAVVKHVKAAPPPVPPRSNEVTAQKLAAPEEASNSTSPRHVKPTKTITNTPASIAEATATQSTPPAPAPAAKPADNEDSDSLDSSVPAMQGDRGVVPNEMPDIPPFIHVPTVVSIAIGGASFQGGDRNSIGFPDGSFSIFKPRQENQEETLFNAFFGWVLQINPQWSVQAGFSYTQPKTFTLDGTESQNTSAYSYGYSYNVVPRQMTLEARLFYQYKNIFHPYVLAGIGQAFNSVYFYQSAPPPDTGNSPTFSNHNNTSFSYSVGFGVDVDVMENIRLGVGYRFQDFGTADLGRGNQNGNPFSGTLQQKHLYANAFVVQFSCTPF
jgi:opacity protein-like surface antigen